ncbi:MAG: isopentenyl-diphosphate delta-isomerase [Saprospiraceae bacterium]
MSNRKEDHINLALKSETLVTSLDSRFNYDPVHGSHPSDDAVWPSEIIGKTLNYPVWISSMTGGAMKARDINERLARLCGEYHLGMGLGSCRKIIDDPSCIPDFQVRRFMGSQPLFANLGIAQCESWLNQGKISNILKIIEICQADGLIIHLNPMQEWMQLEGDRINESPLITICRIKDQINFPIIVKEVGQGISSDGLEALMKLDLAAIEFGAYGGTNFALLELLRSENNNKQVFEPLFRIGHSAEQMVEFTNDIILKHPKINCKKFIISGGIKNFLDAYYLLSLSNSNSLYGMASGWLEHASKSYEDLQLFFTQQMQGLMISKSFLQLKKN